MKILRCSFKYHVQPWFSFFCFWSPIFWIYWNGHLGWSWSAVVSNKTCGLCLSAYRWLTVHGIRPAQQYVCSDASAFWVDADTLFSCRVPEWEAYLQCCSQIILNFKNYLQRWLQSPVTSPARAEYLLQVNSQHMKMCLFLLSVWFRSHDDSSLERQPASAENLFQHWALQIPEVWKEKEKNQFLTV